MSLNKIKLPSVRYPIFIDAFDKFVKEKQKEIDEVRIYEQYYIMVKFFMDKLQEDRKNLSFDLSINPKHYKGIVISTMMSSEDKITSYKEIVKDLGILLKNKEMHHSGIPSCSGLANVYNIAYSWIVQDKNTKKIIKILFIINIPYNIGTSEFEFDEIEVSYTTPSLKLKNGLTQKDLFIDD